MNDTVVNVLIMAVCVLLSAYFSATETAFSSINKTRLRAFAEKGDKKAELALNLAEDYNKLISTILVGNNIVNIALASIGTVLFVRLYGDIGATVSTVVVTVAVLIFGEITPKSLAKDFPEKFAMFSAPIIKVFIFVLMPINFIFSAWKKLVSNIFKNDEESRMSHEELIMLVEEVQQEGTLDEDEGDLVKNAIEFAERRAVDILTHRVDIEAVSVEDTNEEVAKAFAETQFSRLLVYSESIDNVVGVIHQKDFYTATRDSDVSVKEIMSEPVFVQKGERISDLLKLLQKQKSHVAVVLDEYGGTYGIVTMEDILEELVGEIWDEHDEVVEAYSLTDRGSYIVDCAEPFDEFCDRFAVPCSAEHTNINAWVLEQLRKIPEVGDAFEYEGLSVSVCEAEGHRATKVEVVMPQEDTDAPDEKD